MDVTIVEKEAFCVIGKAGSTDLGAGFVSMLWKEANARFGEIADLAKKNADGSLAGCWGAMSNRAMEFLPWEDNFTRGMYLAGVECEETALPPDGWTKWEIPGFRYIRVRGENDSTFPDGLRYLSDNGYTLTGAVQDYTDPANGQNYMCFPIARL